MTGNTLGSKDKHSQANKVIVAGSRSFEDWFPLVDMCVSEYIARVVSDSGFRVEVDVSGTARGADTAGEQWAESHNIPVERFPAPWDDGSIENPGIYRNEQMAEYADQCIVLWDGESSGSSHMIETAREELGSENVHVHLFRDEHPPGTDDSDDDGDDDSPSDDTDNDSDSDTKQTVLDSVTELDGVGSSLAANLAQHNIQTVQDIKRAGIDGLTNVKGFREKRAGSVLGQAQAICKVAEREREQSGIKPNHQPGGFVARVGVVFGDIRDDEGDVPDPVDIDELRSSIDSALDSAGIELTDDSTVGHYKDVASAEFGPGGSSVVRSWLDDKMVSSDEPDLASKSFDARWDFYRNAANASSNREAPLSAVQRVFPWVDEVEDIAPWMAAAERSLELVKWADVVVIPLAADYTDRLIERADEHDTRVVTLLQWRSDLGRIGAYIEPAETNDSETVSDNDTVSNPNFYVRCASCGVRVTLDDDGDRVRCWQCDEYPVDTEHCSEIIGYQTLDDGEQPDSVELGVTERERDNPDEPDNPGGGAGGTNFVI